MEKIGREGEDTAFTSYLLFFVDEVAGSDAKQIVARET